MKKEYYYCHCDGDPRESGNCNVEFRLYVRLYDNSGDKPRLVDQGKISKIVEWENKYNATLNMDNPYLELD
tara:strand:- start:2671 stop:2883 length:213 start_codon:yes stop_codon:yes gene_type:complete